MNHFEIKLALRVSDIIQSSSKWVFISGSRQMEGRNTHGDGPSVKFFLCGTPKYTVSNKSN